MINKSCFSNASASEQLGVSTVVQAYVRLENIGLIEARPQSGFYVRAPEPRRLPEPRPRPARAPRPSSIANEVLDMCREALSRKDFVP
ncbi:MAG TPA: hypothetical protein VLB84_04345, partial [Bacteroidia bacterium]|nr:hypothetical protein [Bacteroidia bacterium]